MRRPQPLPKVQNKDILPQDINNIQPQPLNLISKNNSLRLLIIKSSKKINSLLDKQTEMENDFKLEKQV